jgi:hypothetical protein
VLPVLREVEGSVVVQNVVEKTIEKLSDLMDCLSSGHIPNILWSEQ